MIKKIICLLLLSSLMLPATAQQMQLEVIPLNNSTSDQVIPVIRPLLAPGGTVTGMNNQLVIKTTPANLVEIKQLLETIDRPLRSLMITVQQGINQSGNRQNSSISGEYGPGNARISSQTDRPQTGGVVLTGRDRNGNIVRYNTADSQTSNNNNNTYSVQTLEGRPAYIQTGLSVPIPNQNTIITRNGVVVQNTTEYRDANSGFYVLPRVSGNIVTLMVAPQMSSVNQGRIPTFEVQNVQTTVSGRLGEWIQIGGLDQSTQGSNRTITGTSNRQLDEQRTVLIKVEEIR